LIFSLPIEEMASLNQKCDLFWIDHHKSAMERNTELWNSELAGLRSMDNSGCMLTWMYFHGKEEAPTVIKIN